MAKMYGKFDRTHQNSKGWTKASMRHDEERQAEKDVEDEVYPDYVFSHPVAGYRFDSTGVSNDDG
jgi:hypothetical protein